MGESKGDESPVHGRFGSARFFAFHDTATGETSVVANENEHHAHGGCQPLRVLGADSVDAVAVGGIGRHAVAALNGQGIRVLRAIEGTVQQVSSAASGTLEEIAADQACAGHEDCHS